MSDDDDLSKIIDAAMDAQEAPGKAADAQETESATDTPKDAPDASAAAAASPEGLPATSEPHSPAEKTTEEPASPDRDADYIVNRLNEAERAALASLPAEAQDVVRRVLARQDADHSRRVQKLNDSRKQYDAIEQVIAPRRDRWKQTPGMTDATALENLFTVEEQFLRDPSGTIKWLADSYGVDLRSVAGLPADQDQPVTPSTPPVKDTLSPRIEAIERSVNSVMDHWRSETERTVLKELQDFQNSHPMKDYFPLIDADAAAEIARLKVTNPEMSRAEILKTATDRAIWSNPQTRAIALAEHQKTLATQQQAAEAARVTAAKKAAVSVKQDASPGTHLPSGDLATIVSRAMDEMGL